MVWLLYTSTPENREQADSWDNCPKLRVTDRGMNTRDQWWWSFVTKRDAKDAKAKIRTVNKNVGMKLTLREVKEVPHGWQ
jgi:hypothetical protein